MAGKRPITGPVIRDTGAEDMSVTAELGKRWKYLQDGAELGAMLCEAARAGNLEHLGGAVHTLSRSQLEAACMALVLVQTQGVSLDPDA